MARKQRISQSKMLREIQLSEKKKAKMLRKEARREARKAKEFLRDYDKSII